MSTVRPSLRDYRRFGSLVMARGWAWLGGFFQGAISAVFTLLGLGGVAVVLIRLDPLWVVLLAGVIVAWTLAQGAFAAWHDDELRASDTQKRLAELLRAPVPDEHRALLRGFVSTVVQELQHPRPLFLPPDSPFVGADGVRLAAAYGAHFPILAGLVGAYTRQGQSLQDAESALTARISTECDLRDSVEPVYEVLSVHASLRPLLHSIAKDDRGVASFTFDWQVMPDPPPPVRAKPTTAAVIAASSGLRIATLPAEPYEDLHSRASEITLRVEQLFDAAQGWSEVVQIRASHERLLALQPAVLGRARLDSTHELIRMVPDCPICGLNLGYEPAD